MKFSRRLWEAVKLAKAPAYQLAQQADIHPNQLSKWMNGIESVPPEDLRIHMLGELLNVPDTALLED